MVIFSEMPEELIGHAVYGASVAIIGKGISRVRDDKESRMQKKEQVITSIDQILMAHTPIVETAQNQAQNLPDSRSQHYAMQIKIVRDYLSNAGYLSTQEDKNIVQKSWDATKKIFSGHYPIDNWSWQGKAAITIPFELADTVTSQALYQISKRESAGESLGHNLWQMPAFFVGLYIGKGANKVIDWATTSRAERKRDRQIRKLVEGTQIIDLVMDYKPSAEQQEHGQDFTVGSLTGAGKKLYERLGNSVDAVRSYRLGKQKTQEEQRAETRKDFDDLTKGY